MKNNKAFTLLELVLAITILLGIIATMVINYDSLVGNSRYFEARENLKTYLINLKHQSAFQQKEFELTFDPDYNMYSSFEDFYLLDMVTNDLKILELFSEGKVWNASSNPLVIEIFKFCFKLKI